MNMSKSARMNPQSTVGFLPLHDCQVSPGTAASQVVEKLQQAAHLPGVLLVQAGNVRGILSRATFFEMAILRQLQQRSWEDPIESWLSPEAERPLILPDTCRILNATQRLWQRSPAYALDPIVVKFRDNSLRLIQSQDLLRAQSEIVQTLLQTLQQQTLQLQTYHGELSRMQQDLDQAQQLLDSRNLTLKQQQQTLETQKEDLAQQTQNIAQMRQRLISIRQLLLQEGHPLFDTALEGLSGIARSTDHLLNTSVDLAKHLETINSMSSLIQQISKQARFLGLHTAILVNRSTEGGLDGFSRVTTDITRLVNQTVDADQQMNETVGHFKASIATLAQIAQQGAIATQSLIQQVSELDTLLLNLEHLLLQDATQSSSLVLSAEQKNDILAARSQMRKIERVSNELSDLYINPTAPDLRAMLRNIEFNLKRYPKKG
jgi:methyl-accepting chemotaxis protein